MTVAWYVHHHGAGHLARLRATAPLLDDVVVLSSLRDPDGELPWVELPLDLTRRPEDPTAAGTLHWAPLGHDGLRARMTAIATALDRRRVDALVTDVSVEVALLGRLLGVPVVIVGQRGARRDAPHRLAYRQAARVALPWTAAAHLPHLGWPEGAFVGAISRFDDRPFAPAAPDGDVLLVLGAGGHELPARLICAAAAATPRRTWHVAGTLRVSADGIVDHGPDADVGALLDHCSVVVGTGGANVIAEVAAARRPFVCLPQARPFGEQHHNAHALRELGVAEVAETVPPAAEWPALLERAEARDVRRWALLHDGAGARRLADLVAEVAAHGTVPPLAAALAAGDVVLPR